MGEQVRVCKEASRPAGGAENNEERGRLAKVLLRVWYNVKIFPHGAHQQKKARLGSHWLDPTAEAQGCPGRSIVQFKGKTPGKLSPSR